MQAREIERQNKLLTMCIVCFTQTRTHRVNLVGQSESRVVVVWLKAGLPVTGHVQHHDAPLLWQIVGHDHPHRLVGSESMEEEKSGWFSLLAIAVRRGGPSSLKVAVLNAIHGKELSA